MSLQTLTEIDDICEQFEDRQQSDAPTRLEDFVPPTWVGKDRAELIHYLLKIELEYQARRGQAPSLPDLQARFPDCPEVVAAVCSAAPAQNQPLLVEAFLLRLEDAGIVEREVLQDVQAAAANYITGQDLAAELIRQKLLTKFQADEICQGRGKRLSLGNYLLLEKIGAGGMGQVFKARHKRMDRIVAVKLLPTEVSQDANVVLRFQREVKAIARLTHPNIVVAHDADEGPGGIHFLVMEFVEGRDLSQLATGTSRLPVEVVVGYVLQVAQGLAYAHHQGVVHRDIKPSNLLLDRSGTVKILDLGLANIKDAKQAAQQGLTNSGEVIGSIDYMAPEQAHGIRSADPRSDIYSLGCTLFRLLTGRNLFESMTVVQKLLAHQSQPIPALRTIRTEVPEPLDAVFQKMVAKRPDDRFQTMGEVMTALESIQRANATAPAPASKTSNGGRSLARKIAMGLGLAAVVSLLGIWVVIKDRNGREVSRTLIPDGGSSEINEVLERTTTPSKEVSGDSPPPAHFPFDSRQARLHQQEWAKHLGLKVESENSLQAQMVLIPPGEFLMGSSEEQISVALKLAAELNVREDHKARIQSHERPQKLTLIDKPFLIGATEVTIGQFAKFVAATNYVTDAERLGYGESADESSAADVDEDRKKRKWRTPGYPIQDDFPVSQITWRDAVAFCEWLSREEKVTYRLPSVAEWEFACRAGAPTQYSFGDNYTGLNKYGWYESNSGGHANAVGMKLPNAFGLYDMHGNLQEWCQQQRATSGAYRPVRGGTYRDNALLARCAFGYTTAQSYRNGAFGFRVLREIDAPAILPREQPKSVLKPAELESPPPNDPHRALVLQALDRGGSISVSARTVNNANEENIQVTKPDEIPRCPYSIYAITFEGEKVSALGDQLFVGMQFGPDIHLHVVSDTLTDKGLTQLTSGVKHLHLSTPKISDDGIAHLGNVTGIQVLSLANLSNIQGTSLGQLNENTSNLSLSFPIKPAGIAAIGKNRNIKSLSVFDVRLTAQHLQSFSECSLEVLSFNVCGLDDDLIQHLPPIDSLTEIHILNSEVSGKGLSELKKMKNLRVLWVAGASRLTRAEAATLQDVLPNVRIGIPDDHMYYQPAVTPLRSN